MIITQTLDLESTYFHNIASKGFHTKIIKNMIIPTNNSLNLLRKVLTFSDLESQTAAID
jgi:hypothetical protein